MSEARVGRFCIGQSKRKMHCSAGTINYLATKGTSRKWLINWNKLRDIARLHILPKEKLPFTLLMFALFK